MDVNNINSEVKTHSVKTTDSALSSRIKRFGIKGGEKLGVLQKDTVRFTSNPKPQAAPAPEEAPKTSKELEAEMLSKSKRFTENGEELYWVETKPETKARRILAELAANEGKEALKRGDYTETVECLQRAVNNGKRTPGTFHRKAYAEFRLGRLEDSIADYTNALNIYEPLENTHKCRGDAQLGYRASLPVKEIRGEKGKKLLFGAIADYKRAAELLKKPKTFDSLAYAYCQARGIENYRAACGCYKESIALYEELLQKAQTEFENAPNEAAKTMATKKINGLKQAIGTDYFKLGVYTKRGEGTAFGQFDKEAFSYFEKSIEYGHPMSADKNFQMGLVAPTHEERLHYLRSAIEMDTERPVFYKALAKELEIGKGKFETEDEKESFIWATGIMDWYACSPSEVSQADLTKAKEIIEKYETKQNKITASIMNAELQSYLIEMTLQKLNQSKEEEKQYTEEKTVEGA